MKEWRERRKAVARLVGDVMFYNPDAVVLPFSEALVRVNLSELWQSKQFAA